VFFLQLHEAKTKQVSPSTSRIPATHTALKFLFLLAKR